MSSHSSSDGEEENIYLGGGTAATVAEGALFPQAEVNPPQIWSISLTHADKFDRDLVESWKGDMDGILIFSGLFSAIVTAFLIDGYKSLQPDFATANTNLTAQVAILLARSTNQTDPVLPPMPSQNSQTAYLIINALWFLSLAFSLSCALAATLVQQWSRTYLQGTKERFNPRERARMRTYLHLGVQKFYFSEMVGAIPILLHIALFLFFIGLIVFLYNLNTTLAHIMLILAITAFCIYFLLTALPVFFYDCPYKTPLTSVLSYITYAIAAYRPRRRRHGATIALNQWHPEKQTTHLTNLWAQEGSLQGTVLDHTALRWTLLSLTDPSDLELFVGSLPDLLQSDSGTSFTRDGVRAAQAFLFGPDMLAKNLAGLLHSAVPSDTLALSPADRGRLDARAATCLSTVSLLARACEGPTMNTPGLWSAWATTYSNPVARYALAFRAYRGPALAALGLSTALLLARRALIAYHNFLADIHQRAAPAATGPASPFPRFPSEIRARMFEGVYLARALDNVIHHLTGDPASGIGGGALLAQRADELLRGILHAYMPHTASRAPGHGAAATLANVGVGAGAGGGIVNWELGTLAQAARADMIKAKVCFAVLFMYAACSLPADTTGQDALQTLAAPLRWPEQCEYDREPDTAMELLFAVRHAHGEEALTVFDADRVVALYHTIHA